MSSIFIKELTFPPASGRYEYINSAVTMLQSKPSNQKMDSSLTAGSSTQYVQLTRHRRGNC